MRHKHTLVLFSVLIASHGLAQMKPEALTFEVASIRRADPEMRGGRMQSLPGGGIRMENARLRALIEWAYNIKPFQLSGGPDWINSFGWNILAKATQSAERLDMAHATDAQQQAHQKQVRERLRALLAERFQLKVHRESKEMQTFALVVAKHGPKIKDTRAPDGVNQSLTGGYGSINIENGSMELLASFLGRETRHIVQDRTGLTGHYTYTLKWTPDTPPVGKVPGEKPPLPPSFDPDGPTIYRAIEEQLGLKLEPRKDQVETIVIDSVEKASEN